MGYVALDANTTGSYNTAIGHYALTNNTTANYNTAVGDRALDSNVGGHRNTAVGYKALEDTGDNNDNTAVGHMALDDCASAANTAVGSNALGLMTTGASNTAVGYNALGDGTVTGNNNVAVGHQTLEVVTSGATNTGLGQGAGKNLTTGSNNIFIGYDSGTTASPAHQTTGSNIVVIGDNNITHSYIKVDWTVTSDGRDKTDIEPFNHGLSWINKLNPVTYRWDNRSNYDDGKPDGSKKGSQLNVGLIAQDELEVEKEHGYGDTPDNMLVSHVGEDGNYGMQYSKLVPILINAVKELSAKVEELESKLNN